MLSFITIGLILISFTVGYVAGLWDAGHVPAFLPRKMPKMLRYRPEWWMKLFK